jgi:hypothetical protein
VRGTGKRCAGGIRSWQIGQIAHSVVSAESAAGASAPRGYGVRCRTT